jgi:2Fe-2S ferredoxin
LEIASFEVQEMTRVTYILNDGTRLTHDLPPRFSVMEGATRNCVPGIVAECGGCMSCATCHVYVDEAWVDKLEAPSEIETDMLSAIDATKPTSRLSCQITVEPELDGLVVHVPESQTSVKL